jgi:hypothetical protein
MTEQERAMQPRRVSVFFYGLFMDERALQAKGLNPVNPRRALVRGMALRIGSRATLVEQAAATAHGILMDLTHAEIDQLYSDPDVAMYRPEPVVAELPDAASAAALCFNLPNPPGPDEANPHYAARLRELGRRLGLPADYLANIGVTE